MIEFHRWTVYRRLTDEGKYGFTHIVVGGGLVLSCCGIFHEAAEEKCDTADGWTLVRSMPSAVS